MTLNRTGYAWIAPAGGRAVAGSNPVSPITEKPCLEPHSAARAATWARGRTGSNFYGSRCGLGAEFGSIARSDDSDARVTGFDSALHPVQNRAVAG